MKAPFGVVAITPDGRPVQERPTQDVVAMLLATDKYTIDEIARATNMRAEDIHVLAESPLFQTLIREHKQRFEESPAEQALMDPADAEKTVKTLQAIRDGNFVEDSALAGVRLRATQTLFERQLPSKERKAALRDGARVVINIDMERMETMKKLVDSGTGEYVDLETEDGTCPVCRLPDYACTCDE